MTGSEYTGVEYAGALGTESLAGKVPTPQPATSKAANTTPNFFTTTTPRPHGTNAADVGKIAATVTPEIDISVC
ncbi:MAG TPA: hypothetical protein VJX66_23720 [Amycolatopsis sp.]|nr:hypothetical protein [Amycolatopsis sp.]